MLITSFEQVIQKEISPDLIIKRTKPDLCGVFLRRGAKDKYIGVALPPVHIFDTLKETYFDAYKNAYKSISLAKKFIRYQIKKHI